MIVFLVVGFLVIAGIVGLFLAFGANTDSDTSVDDAPFTFGESSGVASDDQTPAVDNTPSATSSNVTENPAYDAIFEGTGIVHFQMFFGLDVASFAKENANGMIACSDYGYKNDKVHKLVETIYFPVDGYTQEQKDSLQKANETQFARFENLSCCEVKFNMGERYLTITCTYNDLDKKSNCTELFNAGILSVDSLISMEKSESLLSAQGYVKK